MNKFFTMFFAAVLLMLQGVSSGAVKPIAEPNNKASVKQPPAQEQAQWDKITGIRKEVDKFAIEQSPRPPRPDANESDIIKYQNAMEQFKKDMLKQIIPLFEASKEYYNKYPKGFYTADNLDLLFMLVANVTVLNNGILKSEDEELYNKLSKDEKLTADQAGELFWINLIRLKRFMETPKDNNEPDKKAIEDQLAKIEKQIDDFGKKFKSQGTLLQGVVELANGIEKMYPQHSIKVLEIAKKYAADENKKRLDGLIRNKSVLGTRPEIKFKAVDGNEVDLSKLKGKVVLMDFWATWCPPCIEELPTVIDTYKKYHSKGFEIIGISFDKDIEAVKKFVKEKGMAWPQYADGKFWDNDWGIYFGIQQLPTMWLVDKDGKVVDKELQGPELADKIAKLLGVEK